MVRKKDPNKPKRSMSSFMFFANAKRSEVKQSYPDLKITEVGKKLGEMWKMLSSDEKKIYEEQASRDSERYQREKANYISPEGSEDDTRYGKRHKRKFKDPSRPKRSMSSFMFFANDKRKEITSKFPNLRMTEVGKRLAEIWRQLTPEEKKIYEVMADKDKERYHTEMEAFNEQYEQKKSNPTTVKRPHTAYLEELLPMQMVQPSIQMQHNFQPIQYHQASQQISSMPRDSFQMYQQNLQQIQTPNIQSIPMNTFHQVLQTMSLHSIPIQQQQQQQQQQQHLLKQQQQPEQQRLQIMSNQRQQQQSYPEAPADSESECEESKSSSSEQSDSE